MEIAEAVASIINSYINDPYKVEEKLNSFRIYLEERSRNNDKFYVREVTHSGRVFFIGDLHGDFETLKNILSKIDYNSLEKGDLKIIFLGDYVDRGLYQTETLLSVLELESMYPEEIFVLRGNHELLKHAPPYPHDFPTELYSRYGFTRGIRIYNTFVSLVDYLDAAIILNKNIIALHGGLPVTTFQKVSNIYEYLLGRNESEKINVITEILWNDPIEENIDKLPSYRGIGYLWGKQVTNWVADNFGIKMVIRGHEYTELGYKINHDGRVLTLFTTKGYPYKNKTGAYAVIDLSTQTYEENLMDSIHFIE
ncbi:serine/threonine protein phosphatase [Fervidicoccus fontis]|uniref:Metallophosphoesterase n=2 Tax=Fervidicoccus fontis TaxID=683846 RepID=H9ZZP0_FERFK|nr:metallophosphoesterase family protein [Fervidicoccus fontis]AFH42197.1 metallophosphoesterase [Fervidicoccus fontis Kam940]MBE9390949.1 serine/threonine protein phosphatase [Fervidicoccus fontis]